MTNSQEILHIRETEIIVAKAAVCAGKLQPMPEDDSKVGEGTEPT